MFAKSKFLMVMLLGFFAYSCSSHDFSRPEEAMKSFYYAIANKDAELYAKSFYEQGQFTAGEIRLGAQYIFAHFKTLKYEIIQKQSVGPDKVQFTMEEVLEKDNGMKFVSKFIVTYVKAGKEWKILNTQDIETRKID